MEKRKRLAMIKANERASRYGVDKRLPSDVTEETNITHISTTTPNSMRTPWTPTASVLRPLDGSIIPVSAAKPVAYTADASDIFRISSYSTVHKPTVRESERSLWTASAKHDLDPPSVMVSMTDELIAATNATRDSIGEVEYSEEEEEDGEGEYRGTRKLTDDSDLPPPPTSKPKRVVDPWEINYESLEIYDRVGKGAFGEVFRGK